MALPEQFQGRKLDECIPASILSTLAGNSRRNPRRNVQVHRSTNCTDDLLPPSKGLVSPPMAVVSQHNHRMFLTRPNEEINEATSSRVKTAAATPHQLDKIGNPLTSVDEGRRQLLARVSQSRTISASNEKLLGQVAYAHRDASFMQNAVRETQKTTNGFFDASIPEDRGGKSKGNRRPRRGLAELSPKRENPPDATLRSVDTTDAIDLFIITKSASLCSGQKIVTDLGGDLTESVQQRSQTDLPDDRSAPIKRDMCSEIEYLNYPSVLTLGEKSESNEDRIGQFGGLIPTLYAMDKLDMSCFVMQTRRPVSHNRYHSLVVSRESKFTGAGFRRSLTQGKTIPDSVYPQSGRALPEPGVNDNVSEGSMVQDPALLPNVSAKEFQQDGALVYPPSTKNP